jgi:hypothetical protein
MKLMHRLTGSVSIAALAALLVLSGRPELATAAPGDPIADVITPEGQGMTYQRGFGDNVGFDGQFLYYGEIVTTVLHRIDVPPPGGPTPATGHVDIPITGAPGGISALSYDASRGLFWAVGADGVSIYQLTKAGAATLVSRIDAVSGRPGFRCEFGHVNCTIAKIGYDGTDDTLWIAPDAFTRVYHYQTAPDALGHAVLIAATPFVDVDVTPNDMVAQCGWNAIGGVAVGGDHLFLSVGGCPLYFEYTKTGTKLAWYPYTSGTAQDLECDSTSYAVAVIWIKDAWEGRIRAYEQPTATSCLTGGGPRTP